MGGFLGGFKKIARRNFKTYAQGSIDKKNGGYARAHFVALALSQQFYMLTQF